MAIATNALRKSTTTRLYLFKGCW